MASSARPGAVDLRLLEQVRRGLAAIDASAAGPADPPDPLDPKRALDASASEVPLPRRR